MRDVATCLVVPLALAAAVAASPNSTAEAAPGPAERSLERCQGTLRSAGVKYVQATQKAIATCLGKIAGEVVKKNAATIDAALGTCRTQLEKIGRDDGRSIADQFAAQVSARCEPAPASAHTLDDLLGSGAPGVAEPLGVATNLGAWCAAYGGDGSVDSLAEWLACARAAQDCAAHGAIAAAFPRAIEWLGALATALPASPARDAAVAIEAALDGPTDDGLPGLQCGVACGPEVDAAACDLPDDCPAALRSRTPGQVIDDLYAAIGAQDWAAVACNYAPDALLMEDQGIRVGSAEIGTFEQSWHQIFQVSPVILEKLPYLDQVRVLFSLDGGWVEIEDGVTTFTIRRGKIRRQSWHGLLTFNGPPPS